MRNLDSVTRGTTSGARRARRSATHLLCHHALGMAFCMSLPTLVNAQATTMSREAHVTLAGIGNMPALSTAEAPLTAALARAQKEDTSIRPFQFRASDEALTDLRRRIQATNWPSKETVTDYSQGVPLAVMQDLARYWATDYDWRKAEAKLNAVPHFKTTIDGLDIHFIHVRSKHPKAMPLIVTHGWPGSVIEQLKIIAPLTDPTKYGGRAEDAFDVIIPSMPGYGFSGKPTAPGWGVEHMAR